MYLGGESSRQVLRIAILDLLQHGWRIGERNQKVEQPGLNGDPVLQWDEIAIAELARGMLKTLGRNHQITQVHGAAHAGADAGHHHHVWLPDAESFRGCDCGCRQPLLQLTQRDDPGAAIAPAHIGQQIGGALTHLPLKRIASHLLDPLQLLMQAGEQQDIGAIGR